MLRRMDPAQDYADAVRRARRDGFALIAVALVVAAGLMIYLFGDVGGHDLATRIQGALVRTFAISVASVIGLIGLGFAAKAIVLSRRQRN